MATGKPRECPALTSEQQEAVPRLLNKLSATLELYNFTTSLDSTTIPDFEKNKTVTHGQLPCLVPDCGWVKAIYPDCEEVVRFDSSQLYKHLKTKVGSDELGVAHQKIKDKVDKVRVNSPGRTSPSIYKKSPRAKVAAKEVEKEAEVAAVGASRGLLVPDSPHGLTPKQLYVHDPDVDDRCMQVPNFQKIIDDLKSKVMKLEEEKLADASKIEFLEQKIVETQLSQLIRKEAQVRVQADINNDESLATPDEIPHDVQRKLFADCEKDEDQSRLSAGDEKVSSPGKEDSSNKDEEAPVLVPESPTTPFKQSPTKSNVKPSPQELMGCAPATILVDLNWDDAQTEVSSLMSFDLGADLDDEVGLFMRDLHTVLQQL